MRQNRPGRPRGPARLRLLLAVLCVLVLATTAGLALYIYAGTHPCWPWEDEGTFAGGSTCDGKQARFDID